MFCPEIECNNLYACRVQSIFMLWAQKLNQTKVCELILLTTAHFRMKSGNINSKKGIEKEGSKPLFAIRLPCFQSEVTKNIFQHPPRFACDLGGSQMIANLIDICDHLRTKFWFSLTATLMLLTGLRTHEHVIMSDFLSLCSISSWHEDMTGVYDLPSFWFTRFFTLKYMTCRENRLPTHSPSHLPLWSPLCLAQCHLQRPRHQLQHWSTNYHFHRNL